MNVDLSLLALFSNASILVQLVMLVLLLSSILSWIFIFQRRQTYKVLEKNSNRFEQHFWSDMAIGELYDKLALKRLESTGSEKLFLVAFREYKRLKEKNMPPEPILEAIERVLRIAFTKEQTRLEAHLSFLATVQSMSPYIGLFGTVWGIMHAFRALSTVQQATLSMVAPGISEALIATAMGLIAAIPAGIAYNRYVQRSAKLTQRYALFSEELLGIFQRKLYGEAGS